MAENKFISAWKILSPGEQDEFIGFFDWRAAPAEKKLSKSLLQIRGKVRDYSPKGKTEQQVYEMYSLFLQYLKQYLALRHLEKNKREADVLALLELESREFEPVQSWSENLRRNLPAPSLQNAEQLLLNWKATEATDRHFLKQQKREYHPALQEKSDLLDRWYILNKLRTACEILNRHNIIGKKYEYHHLGDVLRWLEKEPANLLVRLYALAYHLLDSGRDTDYRKIKEQLMAHGREIGKAEANDLFNYVLNHCIKQINTGKQDYIREAFGLYEELLDSGIIFRKRYMTQWDYKNIITLSMRLKAYDWTEKFLHTYKDKIEGGFRDNAYAYNLSNLCHERGDNKRALRILQEVEFTDVFYALSSRALMLKIYYETEDFEPLMSHLEAFRAFLKRKTTLSAYQVNIHLNLVRLIKKAAELRWAGWPPSRRKKEIDTWSRKIASGMEIANVSWAKEMWEIAIED